MTIHQAGQQLKFQLMDLYDDREAANIAELVMEHLTGWTKIDRVINKTVPLSGPQEEKLSFYSQQLMLSTPIQYVLHEAWFHKMKFFVDNRVLIPRPETDELVEWSLRYLDQHAKKYHSVLDIGTGSGCIPIAIKKEMPQLEVHACDISEGALEVARMNAATHQTDISFHLNNILDVNAQKELPLCDVLISNPPYIPIRDKATMHPNVVEHEPHHALFVEDTNPLKFYLAIVDYAVLHPQIKAVFVEVHEALAPRVAWLFRDMNFSQVDARKDMQDKYRMVFAAK